MKTMRTLSKKSNLFPGGGKGGRSVEADFEELCRQATAKTLDRPDPDIIQQVVESVKGDPGNAPSPQFVAVTLRNRLQLKNPHKVWLSLELIREVMDKCPTITQEDWREVMVEINRIASRPMNRYATDLPVQQRAKGAAFSLLRHIANEGQPEHSPVGSPRSPRSRQKPGYFGGDASHAPGHQQQDAAGSASAWPRVRHAVQNHLAVVSSKLDAVQDMVVSLSAGESQANTESQQQFLKGLVAEMEGFRTKFEPLLAQLSSFDSAEATALMSRSLETLDVINNIINLQDEVMQAKSTPSATLAPITPPAPAPAKAQPASEPLDAFAELQQALNATHVTPSQPPTDPFAPSHQGHPPLPSYPSQSSNPFKPAPYNPMGSPTAVHSYPSTPSYPQSYPPTPTYPSYNGNQPYPGQGSEQPYAQPYHQQQYQYPQPGPAHQDSWTGASADSSAHHQQQYNSYPHMQQYGAQQQHVGPAPYQQYTGPQQQQYNAPQPHAQRALSQASSDAWSLPAGASASFDHNTSFDQPVQPPLQQHTPAAAPPHQPAPSAQPAHPKAQEASLGGDWDSLFARSMSQGPSSGHESAGQLQAAPSPNGHLTAPSTQHATPTPIPPAQKAEARKEADPFEELFSLRAT